jgi:hypothetical protein
MQNNVETICNGSLQCTSDSFNAIHQVEFVEAQRDFIVTANHSKRGRADNLILSVDIN